MRQALGVACRFAAVFDRDFRCQDEVEAIAAELALDLAHVWALDRKETENYLLVPEAIDRAVREAVTEQSRRSGKTLKITESSIDVLDQITKAKQHALQSQYVAKAITFLGKTGLDTATITERVVSLFDEKWREVATRMEIVSGKETLSALNDFLQSKYGVTLSGRKIIRNMRPEEIPLDMRRMLRELDRFRGS